MDRQRVAARYNEATFDRTIEIISDYTDRNHHDQAYLEGARYLGLRKLAQKFELIAELVEIEGHIPRDLSSYRYQLLQDLLDAAKKILPLPLYKRFHSSF